MPKPSKPNVTKSARHPAQGQRVGYVRVSTFEQNEKRQLEGIDVDRTFTDKASGKSLDRPELNAMLKFVREGDTVICHSMDRLGRNLDDLRKTVLGMTERGIQVEFVKGSRRWQGISEWIGGRFIAMRQG